jgi:hypothetical protein
MSRSATKSIIHSQLPPAPRSTKDASISMASPCVLISLKPAKARKCLVRRALPTGPVRHSAHCRDDTNPVSAVAVIPGGIVKPAEGRARPKPGLARRKKGLGQLERQCRIGDGVGMLQPIPQRPSTSINSGEKPTVPPVPHRLLQESATVSSEPLASLAGHRPVQKGEGDGGAGCVLEALVVRSNRLPSIIEIDEKTSVLFVDAAREKRLQYVAPQSILACSTLT